MTSRRHPGRGQERRSGRRPAGKGQMDLRLQCELAAKVTLDHFVMVRIHAKQRFKLRHLQKILKEREKGGNQLVANFDS